MYNFDSYNVLLAIATNIPVLLMTAFVLQGHKCFGKSFRFYINGITHVHKMNISFTALNIIIQTELSFAKVDRPREILI